MTPPPGRGRHQRVYGVGNPVKPKLGDKIWPGQKFYFARCCGKVLLKKNRIKELGDMSPLSRSRAKAVMKEA